MIDVYTSYRKSTCRKVDEGFHVIYDQSLRMADKVGSIPCMPRIHGILPTSWKLVG